MVERVQGAGCAITMVGINILLMGFLASQFARGPYASWGQELWYRYGSLGFLLFGAILPAAGLAAGARRSSAINTALMVWMFAALFGCLAYALMSGGGV